MSKMYVKAYMLVPKCIYLKSIFAKCTRLACLPSFASLFTSIVFETVQYILHASVTVHCTARHKQLITGTTKTNQA